ncbi:hypothetical protein FS842_009922 [Serendipita sp. 407]|nr:hypothetical protein FS842_009922 [Serendipita sp. 407]
MFKVTAATLLGLATFLPTVLGVSEWGQCGGQTYTGSTTCDSGLTCVYSNPCEFSSQFFVRFFNWTHQGTASV